jgi:hypothetical protein
VQHSCAPAGASIANSAAVSMLMTKVDSAVHRSDGVDESCEKLLRKTARNWFVLGVVL